LLLLFNQFCLSFSFVILVNSTKMIRKKKLEEMKIILYHLFNGVIKVIDYLQVLMTILLVFGICKEN